MHLKHCKSTILLYIYIYIYTHTHTHIYIHIYIKKRFQVSKKILENILIKCTINIKKKKAFLNEGCKEIQRNNKMGKIRDLFKKTGYQGNTSCKDRHDKGQNGKELTETK